MWKVALFFIAIVAVTSSGRAAADEYAGRVALMLATHAPYSYVAMAVAMVTILGCLLTMRTTWTDKTVYLVRQEVRGENLITICLKTSPRHSRLRSTLGLE